MKRLVKSENIEVRLAMAEGVAAAVAEAPIDLLPELPPLFQDIMKGKEKRVLARGSIAYKHYVINGLQACMERPLPRALRQELLNASDPSIRCAAAVGQFIWLSSFEVERFADEKACVNALLAKNGAKEKALSATRAPVGQERARPLIHPRSPLLVPREDGVSQSQQQPCRAGVKLSLTNS